MSAFIETQKAAGSAVELICRTLGVSRSAHYQRASGQRSARALRDKQLVATIGELHAWHHKLASEVGAATNPNIHMQDVCVFFGRAAARAVELEQSSQRGRLANDGGFEASGNGH